jgi:DNA modification methylase
VSVEILIGDVREQLATLPDNSVDLCVTSPPYWMFRNYDVEGQIGMEPTLAEHLEGLVAVFEDVRRVLKPHGSLFLNYGDCYATTPNGRSAADSKELSGDDRTFRDKPGSTIGGGIKPKDLLMIPNRLAIALQEAGWWVRAEIIWGKTNPMPDSSGSQRPATAHEKIFWLAKSDDAPIWRARDTGELSFAPDLSQRCPLITDPDRVGARWLNIGTFYDANAVLQGRTSVQETRGRETSGRHTLGEAIPEAQRRRIKAPDGWDTGPGGPGSHHRQGREKGKTRTVDPRHVDHINHTGIANTPRGEGRYLRNYEPAALDVWEMAIEPFRDAHFATFPTELARRAILAGCPVGGTVLDPFLGAGTTAMVADRLQRNCIGIELNPAYADIARRRIDGDRGGLLDAMEAA